MTLDSRQSRTMLHEGLSLEVSVLVALLKRNRCAHGRTLYYQRTSMVLQAIQKYKIVELEERLKLLHTHIQFVKKQYQKHKKQSQPQKQQHEERWVILHNNNNNNIHQTTKERPTTPKYNDDDHKLVQNTPPPNLHHELWEELHITITQGLPEILSRIQHASSAYLCEISRGFFLPFCTVAMAALARIRALVMRMGRSGLENLSQLGYQMNKVDTTSSSSSTKKKKEDGPRTTLSPQTFSMMSQQECLDRIMTLFTETTNRNQQSNLIIRHNRDQIQRCFGITTTPRMTHHPSQGTTILPRNIMTGITSLHTINNDNDNDEDDRHVLDDDDTGEHTNESDMVLEKRMDTEDRTVPPDVAYHDTTTTTTGNTHTTSVGDDDIGESVDFSTTTTTTTSAAGIKSCTPPPPMDSTSLLTSTTTLEISHTTSTADTLLQQVQSSKKRNKKKRDIQSQQNSKRSSDDDSPTTTNAATKGGTTRKRRIEDDELPLRQDSKIDKQQSSMTNSKKEKKSKKKNQKKSSSLLKKKKKKKKKDIFDELFG